MINLHIDLDMLEIMKSNLDRIRMHFSDTDTPNSYGVECLLRLKGVQVTQIYTDY